MPYADRTTVPIERTKAEIEATLTRYGADRFAYYAESAVEGIAQIAKGREMQPLLPGPKGA
jgi:hypothetical protein